MSINKFFTALLILISGLSAVYCTDTRKNNDLQGAVITSFSGSVKISQINQTDKFYQLTADKLYTKEGIILSGQIVETGENSRVDLQFRDGVQFRVGPDSKILLKDSKILSGENFTRVLIEMKKGKVYTKVDRLSKDSSFEVSTPTSIAGVRGTDFLTKVEGNKTEVLVAGGSVEVQPENGSSALVEAGKKAQASKDKVDVKVLTEEDKKEVEEMGTGIENIRDDARARMQEIINNFEENKKLIEKAVKDQKESDRAMMDEQKNKDKEMLNQQVQKGKEDLEKVRSDAKQELNAQSDKGKEAIDKLKSNKGDPLKDARGGLDQIKKMQ